MPILMRGCAWIYALFSREDMQTGWGQGGDRAQGADGNMKAERADQQVSNKGKKGRGKLFRQAGAVFSACPAARGAGGQNGWRSVLQQ